jgi:hypothetical protein
MRLPSRRASDLAVLFFLNFSRDNPGKFPSAVTRQMQDGKPSIEPVASGSDVRFFNMWHQDHPEAPLLSPATCSSLRRRDLTPASPCRTPNISSIANGLPLRIRGEVVKIIEPNAYAPMNGLFSEKMVDVLRVNLELRHHFPPKLSTQPLGREPR